MAFIPTLMYSVCITNSNKGSRVRKSLESLSHEIDQRFEIVVVDNRSNDDSAEILKAYAKEGKIRLFVLKSSRGRGRQIAFEKSRGRYVISGIDTDDYVISGRLMLLLDFYHKKCEGKLLKVQESGIIVAPSSVLIETGGWRDLMYSENWDVCDRASRIKKFVWTYFRVKGEIDQGAPSLIARHLSRYTRYRDELRMGRTQIYQLETFGVGRAIDHALARISLLKWGHLDSDGNAFDENDPVYFVDSSEWWRGLDQDKSMEIGWYMKTFGEAPQWASRASQEHGDSKQ